MTIPETTEASLWERARSGDPDAFGSIFDLHEARIFRQARRLTGSYDDAEDVTALVFLEAWRKREAVRLVDGSVVAWLAVTTTNIARNSTRSRNRHRALLARLHDTNGSAAFSSAVVPDPAAEVDERMDRAALAATARAALARLPRRDQDVIALCILQGLTTQEASEALDIAPGTVKSRLSRARGRLSADVLAALAGPPLAGGSPSAVGSASASASAPSSAAPSAASRSSAPSSPDSTPNALPGGAR
ncbi:RNA polymerase sigma factor [Herbiconiux solani]|uniref:RNA polymerase sigma factor n=1 Tax=Herbiconiux solani TaxID=661329 RepID=UPI001FDF64B9|nr:RNA polymerase sigma factor [Herbiconiux solani]